MLITLQRRTELRTYIVDGRSPVNLKIKCFRVISEPRTDSGNSNFPCKNNATDKQVLTTKNNLQLNAYIAKVTALSLTAAYHQPTSTYIHRNTTTRYPETPIPRHKNNTHTNDKKKSLQRIWTE